jgi:hypothetical protein
MPRLNAEFGMHIHRQIKNRFNTKETQLDGNRLTPCDAIIDLRVHCTSHSLRVFSY